MIADRIPMSKEGYEKLKTQLDTMNNEEMPRIAEAIAEARALATCPRTPSTTPLAKRRGCSKLGSTSCRTSWRGR